jgi:hypothetical protein
VPIDIPIEMRKSPPEELVTAKPEIISPPDALYAKQKRINWGKPGPHHDNTETYAAKAAGNYK